MRITVEKPNLGYRGIAQTFECDRVSIKKTLQIRREQKPCHVNKCSVVSREAGPMCPRKEVPTRGRQTSLPRDSRYQGPRKSAETPKAVRPKDTQIRTTREWLSCFLGRRKCRRCQDHLAVRSTGS